MTPALRERLEKYRLLRQSELIELASLVDKYGLSPDSGPLRDTASDSLGAFRTVPNGVPGAGRLTWGYRIERLQLRLEAQKHCRPRATEAENLVGSLSVDVEEYLPAKTEEVGESYDCLRRLDVQFNCDARVVIGAESHDLRTAWHVDTHLHTNTASGSIHPRFHFQVGGQDLADIDHTIRGALLLDAPRPALAPLDGALAVDFVLSHYCGTAWEILRLDEARYGRVRRPSIKRYWQPYYNLIAAAVVDEEPVQEGTAAALLLPNLLTQ